MVSKKTGDSLFNCKNLVGCHVCQFLLSIWAIIFTIQNCRATISNFNLRSKMFGHEFGARNETERLLFKQAGNQYHLEELLEKLDLEKALMEKQEQVIIEEIKEAFMENEQENLKILARKIENLRITVKRLDNLRRFIEVYYF